MTDPSASWKFYPDSIQIVLPVVLVISHYLYNIRPLQCVYTLATDRLISLNIYGQGQGHICSLTANFPFEKIYVSTICLHAVA